MRRSTSIHAARDIAAPSAGLRSDTIENRRSSLSLLYFRSLQCLRNAAHSAHETFFPFARLQDEAWGRPALLPARVRLEAMATNSRRGLRNGTIALGGLLVLGAAGLNPQPAMAQGLFGTLFGGFDTPAQSAARYRDERLPVRAYAPTGRSEYGTRYEDRLPFSPFDGSRPERREARPAPQAAQGGTVHCVRTCDGRYFPVPRSAGGVRLNPAAVCSALCPAAETKVFHGSDMQYARSNDGERYASLDNAFAFRDRIVPDCSCTGKGSGGLAQIDIESDPTLRAGDIVVTAEGPTVFNGGRQFPYQTADFTPIEDYGRLNRQLREKLAEMQVNTEVAPVVPPQRIAVTAPERPVRTARQAASEQTADDRAERRRVRQQRAQAERYAEPRYQQPQRSARQDFPLFRLW